MLNLNDLIFKSAISKEETEQEEQQELNIPEDAFSDSSSSEDIEEFEDEEYDEFEDYYCIDDDNYKAFDDMKIRFCNESSFIPDKINNMEDKATKLLLISRLQDLKCNLIECIDLASNYHVR